MSQSGCSRFGQIAISSIHDHFVWRHIYCTWVESNGKEFSTLYTQLNVINACSFSNAIKIVGIKAGNQVRLLFLLGVNKNADCSSIFSQSLVITITWSPQYITTLSSSPQQPTTITTTIPPPCHHHTTTTPPPPYHYHTTTIPPPYHHHTTTTILPPYHHHLTTTIPPPYHHHITTIPPPYHHHTTTIPPPYHHHHTTTIPPPSTLSTPT